MSKPSTSAIVTVSCPNCGRIEVRSDWITVVAHGPGAATYAFTCWHPGCGEVVVKPAPSKVFDLLTEFVDPYLAHPVSNPEMDDIKIVEPITEAEVEEFCDVLYRRAER